MQRRTIQGYGYSNCPSSKHRALSWDYATKLRLLAEVDELLCLAETADADNIPDGMNIPEELTRRQDRLAAIAEAKQEIERRAAKRYEQEEQVAHAQKKWQPARQKQNKQVTSHAAVDNFPESLKIRREKINVTRII